MRSADGAAIAVHRSGPADAASPALPVVLVGGAFSTASDASALADAVVAQGFEAVTFDRRARGDSGDTKPYAPECEAEDVAAVIDSVGGSAIVLGHSSGALLALLAAAHLADSSEGASITHLFLSEPPMRFGKDEPGADLAERLQSLVDEGRGGEAVTLFQLEGVGLPLPVVEQIKASPLLEHLTRLAQSTVYDATIAAATSTPSDELLSLTVPTTVLVGVETMIAWTPEGFIGQMFAVMKPFMAAPPEGAQPPPLWGTEAHVRKLLGERVELTFERERVAVSRFESGAECRDFFKANYGPTIAAYRGLADQPERLAEFDAALAELGDRHLASDDTCWEYLLTTGTVR